MNFRMSQAGKYADSKQKQTHAKTQTSLKKLLESLQGCLNCKGFHIVTVKEIVVTGKCSLTFIGHAFYTISIRVVGNGATWERYDPWTKVQENKI